MHELVFGQAVKVRHEAIEFGAKPGAFDRVGGAVAMVAQADFLRQCIELRGLADEPRRSACDLI